jgi:hypothetical protein
LRSGELVAEIAVDTGISPATLFRWKAQALIDAGVNDGVPSVEADELAVAHRRITQHPQVVHDPGADRGYGRLHRQFL